MGTTLIYRTGWALLFNCDLYEGINTNNSGSYPLSVSCTWKDTSDTAHSTIYGMPNRSLFGGLYSKLFATSTNKDTFKATDNVPATVEDVTVTASTSANGGAFTDDHVSRTSSLTFANSGETEATVNSLTGARSLGITGSSSAYALTFTYVFDTPITLSAGESKTIDFTWGFKF